MKIIITEEQKKKLFIPRKLSGKDSKWTIWNNEQPIKDGVRINQYNINNGKKEGYWEGSDEGFFAFSNGVYVNGNKEGLWKVYHANGNLSDVVEYKNDELDGYWVEYDSDGDFVKKYFYKNGDRVNPYFEN
jgi:hypothetical protein